MDAYMERGGLQGLLAGKSQADELRDGVEVTLIAELVVRAWNEADLHPAQHELADECLVLDDGEGAGSVARVDRRRAGGALAWPRRRRAHAQGEGPEPEVLM
ncbi:MAG: hypothetical protein HC882_05185 [Acidobacteria bacterium]|nr:hypothetical protein [Acidobacteriota bacterium]